MELTSIDKQVEQYNREETFTNEIMIPLNDEIMIPLNDEIMIPLNDSDHLEKAAETTTTTVVLKSKHDMKKLHYSELSELYATDLEMNGKKETIHINHDIQLIMDLYHTDQNVEKSNNRKYCTSIFDNEHESFIFNSLVQMDVNMNQAANTTTADATADSNSEEKNQDDNNDEIDFVDPITELIMREIGIITSPQCQEKCWGVKDIMDLVMTDALVDGYHDVYSHTNKNHEAVVLEYLHGVDCDVDNRIRAIQEKKEMDEIMELYKLDLEVEMLS